MAKKKDIINESSGGYISVDRKEALIANWDIIKNMTLPGSNKQNELNNIKGKLKELRSAHLLMGNLIQELENEIQK